MATYRNIQMSFWNDPDVIDSYTAKDRLFYLYVLTNPHTNLCGCYEISLGQIAYETGLSREEIDEAVNRAETIHKTIIYSRETKELLILNWSKYNWTDSEKVRTVIAKEIQKVKDISFRQYLTALFEGEETYGIDTVSIGYQYPIQDGVYVSINNTLNTDNNLISNSNTKDNTNTVDIDKDLISNNKSNTKDSKNTKEEEIRNNIIDYLNNKRGTHYKSKATIATKNIHARLNEGYSLEDFYKVIDTKVDEWTGTDFEKYLTPETLFGNKFDKYLNQNPDKSSSLETIEADNDVPPDDDEEIISDEEYEKMMGEQYA